MRQLFLILIAAFTCSPLFAEQEGIGGHLYYGAGDDSSRSLGLMFDFDIANRRSDDNKWFLGADVSREGRNVWTLSGDDSFEDVGKRSRAWSLTGGKTFVLSDHTLFHAGVVIGQRRAGTTEGFGEHTQVCTTRSVGGAVVSSGCTDYDAERWTEGHHSGVYGVLLQFSFRHFNVGVRATGDSTMLMIGGNIRWE